MSWEPPANPVLSLPRTLHGVCPIGIRNLFIFLSHFSGTLHKQGLQLNSY